MIEFKKPTIGLFAMMISSITNAEDVYEIVSFQYKEDIPFKVQKQSTESLNVIVSGFKGFKSRNFYYSDSNGRWIDLVVWETMEDAKRASEQAMEDPEALKIFALMDEQSMVFSHYKKLGGVAED